MNSLDRAAVRAALNESADDLLTYLERRVIPRDDAADLLNETLLQAWRRIDAFPAHDPTRQRMWLFTIAANVLANHHRSRRRRSALTERLRLNLATASPAPDIAETNAIRDAVLQLHTAQRELVMLIHWDGFTIVEAAELLGLNASTARTRYSAARTVLREALTENIPI